MPIPFTKSYLDGKEIEYINQALSSKLCGNGQFTQRCEQRLETKLRAKKVLLTHSCTAALEMAALLIDIKPGDEIIMPSYTFVSTANAFVLQGGVPVFVDIRSDTLNIDERKIESAITSKTKAVIPVHYAGVGCEMESIMHIAKKYNLYVIEDAAQALMASYQDKPLGSFGHLAAFSFHETKNIISGEGGALIINDQDFVDRAEIIWEKGTNRKKFVMGEVDKYTWVDKGSSFLPSELTAALLWRQLEIADFITQKRLELWHYYYNHLQELTRYGIQLPRIPKNCRHNAHIFYLIFPDSILRERFIQLMKKAEIQTVFHYIPLHSSPAGSQWGRSNGDLTMTDDYASRIVRLPLWVGLESHIPDIVQQIEKSCKEIY